MRLFISSLRRPRHPLARALSVLLGMVLLAVLLVFGLAVAGVLLIGGGVLLAWRQWKHGRMRPTPATTRGSHQPEVLEGEFVVIRSNDPVAH